MIEIPVDGVDAVRFEKRIAFGEVLAAEKSHCTPTEERDARFRAQGAAVR